MGSIRKGFPEEVTSGLRSENWVSHFGGGMGKQVSLPCSFPQCLSWDQKSYILPEEFPGLLTGPAVMLFSLCESLQPCILQVGSAPREPQKLQERGPQKAGYKLSLRPHCQVSPPSSPRWGTGTCQAAVKLYGGQAVSQVRSWSHLAAVGQL